MQSNVTKQRNAEAAAADIGSKMESDPSSVTKEDAQHLHSRVSRAEGGRQPAPGSLPSEAQSLASANESGTGGKAAAGGATDLDSNTQSQLDRKTNYAEHADHLQSKLNTDPSSVTKEEADKMHSREQRAFGTTEKGGLASKAQHQVAENEGATS